MSGHTKGMLIILGVAAGALFGAKMADAYFWRHLEAAPNLSRVTD